MESELQAFQALEAEEEEFYLDTAKETVAKVAPSPADCEGDEGFCDRLDQKSEQFASSLSLIATH